MSEGKKFDGGKPRWDLVPFECLDGMVDILTFGAKKYAPNNWQKVPDAVPRYKAALLRHLTSWLKGEKLDPESGRSHLQWCRCNLIFLIWFELKGEAK